MKDKLKKYLLPNLPYLFFVYLFDKLCQTVRLAPGLDASEKLLHIGQGFQTAFSSSAPSFHALDICVGILGAVFVRLAVYVKGKNAKKYRKGMEYGSARWGRPEDIAIEGQPKEQIYYHRSIQDIFNLCFRAGFVIDGFYEECFKTNKEIPMVMIVRLKKVKRDSLK